ncbi:MAG: hypothetical protein TH68_07750 [Candidatus Synechococcus spongiarum 142]|uniref:Glycerophosphoryl diester phosphodiesterase membrane domain-containing protein n=1 Tax=Candidatus Synechococcus spongiarum 142 TaxID=1608213 RepID=A0A6N3X2H7_9SYNE|nr:MAG: hypothetical protein TH68_07750 [Candidatus Synechococcus spongiarum 142]
MSIPANASEAPSIAKVWQQVKDNAPTFATIWGIILITALIYSALIYSAILFTGSLGPVVLLHSLLLRRILSSLLEILITAVPAIYYTTDRCPKPGEIVGILTRKPLRYVLSVFLFAIVEIVGLLLCIIPGILVSLTTPLYVYYVFTTDLELTNCLSKSFKGIFQDSGYLVVSLLCGLAVIASILLCFFPCLVVLPMTALYMQNYIHYKGLVRARELA